jgi:transcriptional regulator with XRE-family HTH domain
MAGVPAGTKPAPTDLQLAVATILRGLKGQAQVTNQAIADASGVLSRSQVSGILNGEKHVDIEQLDALCYTLGRPLTDVIAEAERLTDDRRLKETWKAKPLV